MSNKYRIEHAASSLVALIMSGAVMTFGVMAFIAWCVLMLKFAVVFYNWLG